jgi:hypothetical protein
MSASNLCQQTRQPDRQASNAWQKGFWQPPNLPQFIVRLVSLGGIAVGSAGIGLPAHAASPSTSAAQPAENTASAVGAFQVGTAAVDVTPIKLPVAINGGMTARLTDQVNDRVLARALVLAQGGTELAMVVVDSCMLPRDLLDQTKQLASEKTGIPANRIMIAATHTHTAPAAMSCLGTDADPDYRAYVRLRVADGIAAAQKALQPARVGWASVDAADFMAVRRWIRRPDRIGTDPFGNATVRANMHAARDPDAVTGESGPEDPELCLLSFTTPTGEPLAVFANLSMHYFSGVQPISADYFGRYCSQLENRWQEQGGGVRKPLVLMSHGCSGDIWRRDYTGKTPERMNTISIDDYTKELVDLSLRALDKVRHVEPAALAMAEQRIPLKYRTPDAERLRWAKRVVAEMGERLPKSQEEIYAREAIFLHEWQETEIVTQAIRIGEFAVATTPTETYALTGLKIKLQSPAPQTMVLDLANGGDGYIPPPEQHMLGGYNTWPARSAGLEVTAEPKVVQSCLSLLEQIFQRPRRVHRLSTGPAAQALLDEDPLCYWRLNEFSGPIAKSQLSRGRDAIYEPGIVFFLAGPQSPAFTDPPEVNRAAHFAGGRLRVRLPELPESYRISLSIWNGMPTDAREIAGWFYARGVDASRESCFEQVGVAGKGDHAGRLIARLPGGHIHHGRSPIHRWQWHRVLISRTSDRFEVFLDGENDPEISVAILPADGQNRMDQASADTELFFGGSSFGEANWEGRLDEIAILTQPPTGPDQP